jgi:hypothetical protein
MTMYGAGFLETSKGAAQSAAVLRYTAGAV